MELRQRLADSLERLKSRPPTEMGSWVLEGLMDPQPTTEITGRREARMDSFLARDGLRKTIKHRKRIKREHEEMERVSNE